MKSEDPNRSEGAAMTRKSLLDVAWVLFEHPDPDTTVHRVDLATGRLACADWVHASGGTRISDDKVKLYGPRCEVCWP
jgi:hypothetical protein